VHLGTIIKISEISTKMAFLHELERFFSVGGVQPLNYLMHGFIARAYVILENFVECKFSIFNN
jgi:hypothetical protein